MWPEKLTTFETFEKVREPKERETDRQSFATMARLFEAGLR